MSAPTVGVLAASVALTTAPLAESQPPSPASQPRWLAKRRDFQAYAAQFHTTATQLTELGTKAKPRLLILYHASLSLRPAVDAERSTPAALLGEMRNYAGHVVVGRDLDVY